MTFRSQLGAVCLVVATMMMPKLAVAAVPTVAAAEIEHLFVYLTGSGCQFNRNGTWYEPAAARAHLESKYEYFVSRNLIATSEDFIKLAATESSMSHKPYQVRCGTEQQSSASWFGAELQRFRQRGDVHGKSPALDSHSVALDFSWHN